jgi:hypothetical protein
MPAPKDYIKIPYPRQCEHCDYVSNNPTMYHYHKKTHEEIPKDTYCHFGCGCKALFRNTNMKYTCKEKTKKSFIKRLHNQETVDKMKATKRKKFGNFTPEQMKDFRHYARRIRARAQQWAKEQGYVLGKQTYHVDHKFSVWDSWLAGLSENVVNHPANLQILEAKKNSSKGRKSLYTLEELLELTR